MLWMDLVKLPQLRHYWSRKVLYVNNVAKSLFARDRFLVLLRFLHFEDEANKPANGDRVYKLKPLLALLLEAFKRYRIPEENLVIDETMIPFRGRVIFRQYLPGKAHKYGIKLFKLCDPAAYTYTLRINTGKNEISSANPTVSENVVMELMRNYLGKGRTLATDNYYTSLPLCKKLNKRKPHLIGTLRKNRKGLSKSVIQKILKKGEAVAEYLESICVVKWKDRRDVLMLSSKHKSVYNQTGKKDRKTKLFIMKPSCIIEYNNLKMGIDLSDQLSSYYTTLSKTIRWYHKDAFELLLGTSVINSYVLYKSVTKKNERSLLIFVESLVHALTGLSPDTISRKVSLKQHYLEETTEVCGKNRRKKRNRCKYCYRSLVISHDRKFARQHALQVSTFCKSCPDRPWLCVNCMIPFHKN